jgi:hypothetical protein
MLLSWLVITNHCALAQIQTRLAAGAEHAHCHAAKDPADHKAPGDGMRECCRAVKARLADKTGTTFDAARCQGQLLVVIEVFAITVAEPELSMPSDHGPPRAVSFAESVLRHSLPSHAPPNFA